MHTMDFERLDQVSETMSYGSKRCQSSQPRKISRGILVDSIAKSRPQKAEEDAVVPNEKCQLPPHVEQDGKRMESINDGNNGNQSQSVHQDKSLLGTKALHRKASTSEGYDMRGAIEVQPTFSANFSYLKPGLERNARPQCQPGRMVSGSKDVNTAVVNKLSVSPQQPIIIEDDAEKEEIRGSETLRAGLWKILETTSPRKHHPSDCNLSNGPKGSDSSRKSKEEVVPESIPRSDTIESDSDHPNHSLGRQSTLPLGRKRSSNKVNCKKKTEPSLSNHKNKRQKKVNLAREGCSVGLSIGNAGGSLISKQKKGERQGSSSEARKLFFHVQENQVGNQQVDSWRQNFLNTREDDKGFSCVKNSEFVKPKKAEVGKGSPQSPIGNTSEHPKSVHDHLKLQENVDWPNNSGHASFKNGHASFRNTTAQKSDVESPTIKLQTPIKSPATCSPHRETKTTSKGLSSLNIVPPEHVSSLGRVGLDDHGPLELSGIKGIKSFSLLVSRQNEHMPGSPTNVSHDARKLQGTVGMFCKSVMVEKSAKGMHELMSQSSDSEASEEDWDVQAKEASLLHQGKTKCHPGRSRVAAFSSDIASGKGIPTRPLEPTDQMDELARAVALLSSALVRVKNKMKSIATKKSAEILMSAADKIHLQLQNAESHIQADVGKLTSFSKSKKKHLETRFEELQGELNVMHQSFKEEVIRHLQKCKSTVEGLEAHQSELKVAMEKQRASHRKLLLQAEEAMDADLIDAQKRITAIQNSAKKKMVDLKNIAAHCLKDGIIT